MAGKYREKGTAHFAPDRYRGDAGGADGELQCDLMIVVRPVLRALMDEPHLEPMAVRDEIQCHQLKDNRAGGVPDMGGVILGETDEGAGGGTIHERSLAHTEEPKGKPRL
jgi:hypothetical protein